MTNPFGRYIAIFHAADITHSRCTGTPTPPVYQEREFNLLTRSFEYMSLPEISKPVKVLRPIYCQKSRAIGLVIVIIIPAIIGGTLGWFFPLMPPTQVPTQLLKP